LSFAAKLTPDHAAPAMAPIATVALIVIMN
jgi:hypothetical protein